ncbi:MAG: hypothetical protein ACI9BD_001309 [Candidatus Marinamargulisbacteria bacterium]|jgi:hypothetical protein
MDCGRVVWYSQNMKNGLVFGASGHAKVCMDVFEKEGEYRIAGLLDISMSVGDTFFGYPFLGRDEDALKLVQSHNIDGIHPTCQVAKSVEIGNGNGLRAHASVVGGGRLVLDHVDDFSVVMGVSAKQVRQRSQQDPYL